MNGTTRRSVGVVGLLLLLVCPTWAERPSVAVSPDDTPRTVARFTLTLSDGTELKVAGIVGGPAIQLQNHELALDLEFEPRVEGPSGVRLDVFEIERQADGTSTRSLVDSAAVWHGSPSFVGPVFSQVQVDLRDLQERKEAKDADKVVAPSRLEIGGENALKPKAGQCCLACGSTEACGCSVELSCGTCCVGICCNNG